ncbi:MAG: metal ABC transporter solute-binding protein, Zn/Mn family [Cellvibrionaceae bacterium]
MKLFFPSLLLLASFSSFADINIVSTIRPLTLLAQELAAPGDTVEQLLEANRSPHHYQLSVSDRQQLESATLVLWVGPELESFLEKALLQTKASVVQASRIDSINWPETAGDHDHDSHAHHGHKHDHDRDPHLWLDPYNLGEITQVLTQRLVELNPEDKDIYQQNSTKLLTRLGEMDRSLRTKLVEVQDKAFVVSHPAYNHFVQRYGLSQLDYIVATPERAAGAKHLYQLRALSVSCIFGEEAQNNTMASRLADHIGARMVKLDPLGATLQDGASAVDVVERLGETLFDCLAAKS